MHFPCKPLNGNPDDLCWGREREGGPGQTAGAVGVRGRGVWGVGGPGVKVNQTAEGTGHLGVYPTESEELGGGGGGSPNAVPNPPNAVGDCIGTP